MQTFKEWWEKEGSGYKHKFGQDLDDYVEVMCALAWTNGEMNATLELKEKLTKGDKKDGNN